MAVVANPETAGWVGEVAGVIAVAGDAERLGEASRTAGKFREIAWAAYFEVTRLGHFFDSAERFQSAKENASGATFGLAGDIETVVIAVDEVDISVAGRAEEDGVAQGWSGGGVGGGVFNAEVGFDFDDAAGEIGFGSLADEDFSEQVAGYAARGADVEGTGERDGGGHSGNLTWKVRSYGRGRSRDILTSCANEKWVSLRQFLSQLAWLRLRGTDECVRLHVGLDWFGLGIAGFGHV